MSRISTGERSLIIGASGQIGARLIAHLGPRRALAVSRRPGVPGSVGLDLKSLAENSEQAQSLFRTQPLNAVYCAAAMTDVEGCESDPQTAMQVNCVAPASLAALAASHSLPFVFFSTEYVFDGRNGPYDEAAAAGPISAYGRSKWAGEIAVSRAHPQALIIRTTVVYGPDPGTKNFLYGLRRSILAGQTFRVADDQISSPTYNRDLAQAVISLVSDGASGVFHVCGPELLSRLEFAVRAAKAMGIDHNKILGVPTAQLGQRAPRPLNAGLLTGRLQQFLPKVHMQTIEESIRDWMNSPGF